MSRPVGRAVWLAGAAAILPLAAMSAAEAPAMTPVPDPARNTAIGPNLADAFAPPAVPLVLTRTLRHELHDGQAVVTRRSYRVRFVPESSGFRIDGDLAQVTVDAPPGLEALATLERKRPDAGLFPMRLDAGGRLLPAGDPPAGTIARQAIAVAAQEIARMPLPAPDAAQAQGFAAQLRTRPYRTAWPSDLFRPVPGDRQEQRTVPLAEGLSGQVTTEIAARADAASGLVTTFRRKVTTDLGGDTRVVIEEWTLSPES